MCVCVSLTNLCYMSYLPDGVARGEPFEYNITMVQIPPSSHVPFPPKGAGVRKMDCSILSDGE